MKTTRLFIALICATLLLGCANQQVTKDPVTGQNTTNYVANAAVTQVAGVAQMAAPLVPQPWGALIGALGVLGTAVAGAIATYKNKRVNEQKAMLNAVIIGVEQANNPATKLAIQDIATALGANDKLHKVVQTITSTLPGTK